jgi:tetratricopeptide (TPR) repeat protein
VRLQSLQLRLRGKWKAAGYVLALGTVLMMAVAVWSGYVRVTRYRASTEYAKLTTPLPIALRPEFQPGPAEADAADRALYLYTRGGRGKDDLGTPGVTGIGWKLTPDEQLQLAYIHVLRGDLAAALARMDRIIETGRPQDSLIFQAGQLMQALKKPDAEALAMYRRALDKHPELDGVRSVLAGQELAPGGKGADAARAILAPALEDRPIRPQALLSMARLELNINAPGASATALELAERAVGLKYGVTPDSLMSAAGVIAQTGDRETDPKLKAERRARAVALAERAAEEAEHGHGGPGTMISAAGLLAQFGQPAPAQDLAERAVAKAEAVGPHTGQTQTLVSAANLLAGLGKPERALELYRKAVAIITSTPRESAWDLHGMAFGMLQLGMGQRPSAALVEEGVRTLEKARDAAPSSGVIRSDLAMAYYAQGRKIDALREMTAAAEASDRSAFLASRLSDLLAEMDRAQEAVEWQRKATQREAAAQPR